MNKVLELLESIEHFPYKEPSKDNTRANVMGKKNEGKIQAFTLGKVRSYSESELVDGANNRRFPELHKALKALMRKKDPNFKFGTIQINKNVKTAKHIDKNNIGLSYCLALGNFRNGGLELYPPNEPKKILDNRHKWVKYDGKIPHKTASWSGGDRYALVFFNHS